jgi:hypothetical protein
MNTKPRRIISKVYCLEKGEQECKKFPFFLS